MQLSSHCKPLNVCFLYFKKAIRMTAGLVTPSRLAMTGWNVAFPSRLQDKRLFARMPRQEWLPVRPLLRPRDRLDTLPQQPMWSVTPLLH